MIDQLNTLQLETTGACNATCPFCPTGGKRQRKVGRMSMPQFRSLVDQGVDMGVKLVVPFGNEEPLVDTRFFDFLDYIRERGLSSVLFTNASLLTKEKADRLAQYANLASVVISFHGGDKETYERVMGLNYDKVKANVEYFLSRPLLYTPAVYLLDYPDTHASVPAFLAQWGKFSFVSAAFYSWGGNIPVSAYNAALQLPPKPCDRMLSHAFVLWNGTVAQCCMDAEGEVVLGNVNDEPLRSIWNRNQPMRDRHKALDFSMPLCQNCTMNRYGG